MTYIFQVSLENPLWRIISSKTPRTEIDENIIYLWNKYVPYGTEHII